jgi:hypothetical protein
MVISSGFSGCDYRVILVKSVNLYGFPPHPLAVRFFTVHNSLDWLWVWISGRVVFDADFVRAEPVGVRHLADNIAVAAASDAAVRVKRFLLLHGCQQLVYPFWRERTDSETGEIKKRSEFRVSVCCRHPVADEVKIYRHDTAIGYSSLMRCGNVYGCTVCCAKIMRRRGEQIAALFQAVHERGGSAMMITFTAGHSITDPLSQLLLRFKKAKAALEKSRVYRDLMLGSCGHVCTTETPYGEHGWHVHQHDARFFRAGFWLDADELAAAIFPVWQRSCECCGLHTIEFFKGRRIGVDVRRAWDASEYLTKFDRERDWSLSAEMTSGRLKTGGSGLVTPWGILEDAIIRGKDSPAAALWIEYLRATKGKACVSLRGASKLCKEVGIPVALDDFVDANDVGEGEVVGTISADAFDRVVRGGGLGRLLEAARRGGLSGLEKELQIF